MAWQRRIEYFPGQPDDVVYELFDEDVPRYKEAEQQVRDEIASRFEAERHLGEGSKWWNERDSVLLPIHGWPWPINTIPYRYKMSDPLISKFDIDYGITEKAIRAIESVEPGVHRYLPMDCYLPDGSFFRTSLEV